MHELHDEKKVLDRNIVESPELLGKECAGCMGIFPFGMFRKDYGATDGRYRLCLSCENSPRLSTEEHTHRLREMNARSHAVQRQRWEHQDDYRNDEARLTRYLHYSDVIRRLRKLAHNLYFMDGRIEGDIAIYKVYGRPQPQLEGRDFEYLMYMPTGFLPEFSTYEFNERDVPVKEKKRGWRTLLLRLIRSGIVTERQCAEEFGEPEGQSSTVWKRTLFVWRNGHD